MKKNIFYTLLVILVLGSCTKDFELEMYEAPSFPPVPNSYRVTRVEGTNDLWGDFTLMMEYDGNSMLKSCYRINCDNDTVGEIYFRRSSSNGLEYFLYVKDKVNTVDSEAIKEIDDNLKELLGEGNYSLSDNIPTAFQQPLLMSVLFLPDGRISRQKLQYFGPDESRFAVGEKFDYTYKKIQDIVMNYEYNDYGQPIACRKFVTDYDLTDIYREKYTLALYKDEYAYNNDRLAEIVQKSVSDGENLTVYNRFTSQYQGDNLVKMASDSGLDITYNWSDGKLASIQDANGLCSYTWNDKGYVETISLPDGSNMRMYYEAGNGNFGWLSLLTGQIMGMPVIK